MDHNRSALEKVMEEPGRRESAKQVEIALDNIVDRTDKKINQFSCLTDEELKKFAKRIFDLSHEADYENTIKILREVYNAGRSRGVYEVGDF